MSTPHDGADDGVIEGVDNVVIAAWIREHPEVWGDAGEPMSAAFVDGVVDDIVSGARLARLERRDTRHRRKLVATAVLGTLVITAGTVGVAAFPRSARPTQLRLGVVCHTVADRRADQYVIEPTADPVGSCAAWWAAGGFDLAQVPVRDVPPLVACVSPTGLIAVYPGDVDVCDRLGLAVAEPVVDEASQALIALQLRLGDELNASPCYPVADASVIAQRILDESEIPGWRVEIREASIGAPCANVAVDATARVIHVFEFEQP